MSDFGKKLQHLREERNITITDLAKMTGISRKTIYDWEAGHHQPSSIKTVNILTKFFNVPIDYFIQNSYKKLEKDISINNILLRLDRLEKRIGTLERS